MDGGNATRIAKIKVPGLKTNNHQIVALYACLAIANTM